MINRITLADCFSVLPEIPAESVDLILTDPPYVTALADLYKSWNLSNHDFEVLADQFARILKPSGQICMFSDYPTSLVIGNALQRYFAFRFYYVWIKSHGQPIGKRQPINNTELILVWKLKKTKTSDLVFNPQYQSGKAYRKFHKGGNPTRKKHNGYLTENLTGDRFPVQTLYYPSSDNLPESERMAGFPCQKPLSLIGYLVNTLSSEGSLVCDPFSGSGTTAIDCHKLNRNFICIEHDPVYYAESVDRLKNEMAQVNLFAKNETSLAGLNDHGKIKVNVPLLTENFL